MKSNLFRDENHIVLRYFSQFKYIDKYIFTVQNLVISYFE